MGAFAIILLPIILFIFYGGNAILVTNLDGILSRTFHNKHKKPLVILHIALLGFSLFHIILQLLGLPVISETALNIVIGLLFPILIFNILIFSKMHKQALEKIRIHNVILMPIGLLMFLIIIVVIHMLLFETFQYELQYYNCYNGKKTTVIDYTYDNGVNSEEIYKRLKKRLEKNASDINEKTDTLSNYAIINVCLDDYSNYSSKRYDMLKLLIDYGADVNIQNNNGNTPLLQLHYPASYVRDEEQDIQNWIKCAQLLLDNGADPYLQDSRGYTIFDYVKETLKNYESLEMDEEDKTNFKAMKKLKKLLIEYGYEEEFEETEE